MKDVFYVTFDDPFCMTRTLQSIANLHSFSTECVSNAVHLLSVTHNTCLSANLTFQMLTIVRSRVLSLLSKLALYFPVLADTDCLWTQTACGHRLLADTDCLGAQTACGHRLLADTDCLGTQTAWGHRLLGGTDCLRTQTFALY